MPLFKVDSYFNILQPILVTLILAACLIYTARRLWKRFRTPQAGDPHCAGCPLAETCNHRHDDAPLRPADRPSCPRDTACDCCR